MSGFKCGDFVRHKNIEQALCVERVNENGTVNVRAPSADGWPYPVNLVFDKTELRVIRPPKLEDSEWEEAPW